MKHALTLAELKQLVAAQFDELQLIETLGLTMETLVELLSDRIEEYYDELLKELED